MPRLADTPRSPRLRAIIGRIGSKKSSNGATRGRHIAIGAPLARAKRTLAATMVIVLLLPGPVGARVIFWEAQVFGADLAFGFRAFLAQQGRQAPSGPRVEKQGERDRRVAQVEIAPRAIRLRVGEDVRLIAIARDRDGRPIGGVRVRWTGEDLDRSRSVLVGADGLFEARVAGRYLVRAATGSVKRSGGD